MSEAKKTRDLERKKEADNLLAEAKKSTQSSFFKKPDWEKAARCYKEAVDKYRVLGEDQYVTQILEGYRGLGQASKETNDNNTAGVAYEKAGTLLAKDTKNANEVITLWKEAALLFRLNSAPDRAADLLVKAAELVADIKVGDAISLLGDAITIFEDEKRGQFSDKTFKKAIALAVKQEKYEAAIKFMLRQNTLATDHLDMFEKDIYKNFLQILILRLHLNEYDKAEEEWKTFSGVQNFGASEEWEVGETLLGATRTASEEDMEKATKKTQLKYLSPPIARLATKLKLSEERVQAGPLAERDTGEGELDLT